jgi:hypothetical protein
MKPPLSPASCRWTLPFAFRSTLESIRFAGANHLCVDLRYDGSIRRIEPPLRDDYPRTFAVISATRRPKARAIARSSGFGCNSPCPPAIVVAP